MASYAPVKLAYNKHEPESGETANTTPVIFLHGLSVAKEYWGDMPQTVANKTKRRVYTVDSRDHGDSEWSNQFSFDANADDLLHFMDTVGEKKAILVGHSMGGITAMQAALKKPERIEKIIVEDMHAKTFPDKLGVLAAYLMHLQMVVEDVPPELNEEEAVKFCIKRYPEILPQLLRDYIEGQSGEVKPRYFFALKRDSNGRYANKANFDVIINALKEPDAVQSELQGRYDGPAYFIYGELSIFKIPDDVDTIKKFFPKAELICIEKASHNVHVDCPEEFMEALLKSLA